MRTSRLCLVLLIVVATILATSVGASAMAFTYTSGFQVQNLSSSTASVTITFYNADGSTESTVNDTISASGSKTYFPLGVSEGFNGAVVISSDQQVAAVVNVHGDNMVANASYDGVTSGSLTVSLPLLMKDNSGYNSWYRVLNVGTSAANVDVSYSDGTTSSAIIQANGQATFDQATETHSAKVFSATITSDQEIAVVVMEESPTTMFAYNGFTGGCTNPVMPLVNANNSGYTTGIQIQNTGSSATEVTVTYTPSAAGSTHTETKTIAPGQSQTFALGLFSSLGEKFIGSARVTGNSANEPLVAIVNQHIIGQNGEAYSAFDPSTATDTVVLPLIMDRNSGWWTGFNVMNVGSSATTVNCTFTGTSYTASATLQPGEALTDLQNGQIASGYVGSATCTAGAGGQIVAVVNELGPQATDQFMVYEGISVQ